MTVATGAKRKGGVTAREGFSLLGLDEERCATFFFLFLKKTFLGKFLRISVGPLQYDQSWAIQYDNNTNIDILCSILSPTLLRVYVMVFYP